MHIERIAEGIYLAPYNAGSDVKLQQLLQLPVFKDTQQLAGL